MSNSIANYLFLNPEPSKDEIEWFEGNVVGGKRVLEERMESFYFVLAADLLDKVRGLRLELDEV